MRFSRENSRLKAGRIMEEKDEILISPKMIGAVLRKNIVFITVTVLVFSLLAYFVTTLFITKHYTSKASLYAVFQSFALTYKKFCDLGFIEIKSHTNPPLFFDKNYFYAFVIFKISFKLLNIRDKSQIIYNKYNIMVFL